MDYSDARQAFFAPRPGEARPLAWDSPARRLRDAIEPLAGICYWSEPAYDALAARGLDFLSGYVWGRGSQLGGASAPVVAAAFGVFEPGLVTGVYADGRSRCSLEDVRAARLEGASAALTAACGEPTDEVTHVADRLLAAVGDLPLAGRPFFAGLTDLEVPADPWARLWHACSMAREHRGDAHLAACVAAGLDGVQANLLTEAWVGWEAEAYAGSRGWSPEAMAAGREALEQCGLLGADGALTDEGRRFREQLETATDTAEAPLVAALGDDLDGLVATCEGWAASVLGAGWFPPDPYKRAAG
ncbi:hypothetical protein GCM10009737_23440 [Nocardioides lentus]|uniref:DUF4872 domain-containing protein n=1 Tax=Nocardioides lentus TaxID=338077 RepID=A0ABN2PGI9_9ACTN